MAASSPTATVVIPSFARPGALARCIEGLSRQSAEAGEFEVVVVDDGTPEPVVLDSSLARGRFELRVLRQDNAGPGVARNLGAASARGEILAFIDDDCVPTPAWLGGLVAAVRRDPDVLAGGATRNGLDGELSASTRTSRRRTGGLRPGDAPSPGTLARQGSSWRGRVRTPSASWRKCSAGSRPRRPLHERGIGLSRRGDPPGLGTRLSRLCGPARAARGAIGRPGDRPARPPGDSSCPRADRARLRSRERPQARPARNRGRAAQLPETRGRRELGHGHAAHPGPLPPDPLQPDLRAGRLRAARRLFSGRPLPQPALRAARRLRGRRHRRRAVHLHAHPPVPARRRLHGPASRPVLPARHRGVGDGLLPGVLPPLREWRRLPGGRGVRRARRPSHPLRGLRAGRRRAGLRRAHGPRRRGHRPDGAARARPVRRACGGLRLPLPPPRTG
ncbi:glycosyltransferase family 2 protein [bacterium]|nr:glycosyltransferase family 2 protein [bacterium]